MLKFCIAHKRQVSRVVFSVADRWSRKLLHSEMAIEQLEHIGIGWASADEPEVNSDNQDGRYNLQRKIVEAEQFSRNLSRKMKARSLEAVKWSLAACRPYRVYQC
jgi:hypothetical protein